MHEALWEFPEGGGFWKKTLPLRWMDIFCNYTLRKVTCDMQFFNLLSPGSDHVILLAECQQLGRCLTDNTKKRPKSKIIEINSKEEEQTLAQLTSAHR